MAIVSKISPIKRTKGEKVTLKYQVKENNAVKDITGMTFKFGAKGENTDTDYKISPIDGTIDDAANGKFSFPVTFSVVFDGVFEVAMYDASSNKTVLTKPGGQIIEISEDVID